MTDLLSMTKQQAFEYMVQKLYDQNAKSLNGTCCVYNSSGNHCAIGWMIPDDEYNNGMERNAIDTLIRSKKFPYINKLAEVYGSDFLANAQDLLHDSCYSKDFRKQLKAGATEFAAMYNLDFSTVSELWT